MSDHLLRMQRIVSAEVASTSTLAWMCTTNLFTLLQIAKLLIIPFVCLVELFWLRRTFTPQTVMSILVVILGVGVV